MATLLRKKIKLDLDTITKDSVTYNYAIISFSTSFDVLGTYDKVYLEKVTTNVNSEVAISLFNGEQPPYFMDTIWYMSKSNFMINVDNPEALLESGAYNVEFIDITKNVRYGARTLYDFDIPNIETQVYGYRIRYYRSADGISVTEYVTDYNVIHKSIAVEDFITKYGDTYRACITPRNLAFRGLNNKNKYNYMLKEIEADISILNDELEQVSDNIDTVNTLKVNDIIDYYGEFLGPSVDAEDTTEEVENIYAMPSMNEFYNLEQQIWLKLKYR